MKTEANTNFVATDEDGVFKCSGKVSKRMLEKVFPLYAWIPERDPDNHSSWRYKAQTEDEKTVAYVHKDDNGVWRMVGLLMGGIGSIPLDNVLKKKNSHG